MVCAADRAHRPRKFLHFNAQIAIKPAAIRIRKISQNQRVGNPARGAVDRTEFSLVLYALGVRRCEPRRRCRG